MENEKFFAWDIEPVRVALLAELLRRGVSVDPDDYHEGVDEWGDILKISLPEYNEKPSYTNEWDINFYDRGGVFTVTAYPVYRGEGFYQAWITLVEESMLVTDESRSYGPWGAPRHA